MLSPLQLIGNTNDSSKDHHLKIAEWKNLCLWQLLGIGMTDFGCDERWFLNLCQQELDKPLAKCYKKVTY